MMDIILKLQTEQQNRIIASCGAQVFVAADSVVLPAGEGSPKNASAAAVVASVCLIKVEPVS